MLLILLLILFLLLLLPLLVLLWTSTTGRHALRAANSRSCPITIRDTHMVLTPSASTRTIPPARYRRAVHLLVIAALAAYFFLLVVDLAGVARLIAGRDEMVQGSAAMAWHAARAAGGEPIYRDCLTHRPHVAAVYGPLIYLFPALIGRTIGASQPLAMLLIGRGLSLLATTITGVLIFAMARRLGARRLFAWIATLAALSNPIFWNISAEYRADPITLCLLLAAVACFAGRDTRPARFLAALPLMAAFLCKPTSVAPLIAMAWFLWRRGRRREASGWLIVGGLLALGCIASLNWLTDGGYRINAFEALRGSRAWSNLLVFPVTVLPLTLPQFAFAAWLIGVRLLRPQHGKPQHEAASNGVDVLIAWLGAAWLLAFLTTVRDGSAEYYFCESLAGASILMALQWQRWLDASTGRPADSTTANPAHRPLHLAAFLAPVVVAIIALPKLEPGPVQRLGDLWNLSRVVRTDADRFARRLALVNELPKPVLCGDDSLSLFANQSPLMMDTWLFSGLIDRGVFDDSAIVGDLESGRFGAVVLNWPVEQAKRYQSTWRIPPAWRDAIMRRYRPMFPDIGGLYVYAPRRAGEPGERLP